jgi:hypothetical protein
MKSAIKVAEINIYCNTFRDVLFPRSLLRARPPLVRAKSFSLTKTIFSAESPLARFFFFFSFFFFILFHHQFAEASIVFLMKSRGGHVHSLTERQRERERESGYRSRLKGVVEGKRSQNMRRWRRRRRPMIICLFWSGSCDGADPERGDREKEGNKGKKKTLAALKLKLLYKRCRRKVTRMRTHGFTKGQFIVCDTL